MIMKLGLRKKLETAAARHPAVRRVLIRSRSILARRLPFGRRHPFDRFYGIETQALLPLYLVQEGSPSAPFMIPYGGCVPSVLRHILRALGDAQRMTLMDLGCGKGRALAIATEFPFAAIIGIELNPDLAAVARRNLRQVAKRFPMRTRAVIVIGDACLPILPAGDLVIFLYHPFAAPLVERLARHIAESADGRSIRVVYENPVHGYVFDDHPAFRRCQAALLPCAADERAFAFDPVEAVVVWALGEAELPMMGERDRPILVTKKDYRATLA